MKGSEIKFVAPPGIPARTTEAVQSGGEPESSIFLRVFLPAADLKYFSRLIAISRVAHSSL